MVLECTLFHKKERFFLYKKIKKIVTVLAILFVIFYFASYLK